jgi:uncharacterized membrane protein
MNALLPLQDPWLLWAVMLGGVALCIWCEQSFKWAARMTGPVLILVAGMALSNSRLMPTESPAYDLVDDYLVPVALPLLLFRANVLKIVRESGRMFLCFHIAAVGTVLGAFVAGFVFRGSLARVPEVTGIMTGSYVGGAVNFVALQNSYKVSPELANPLIVADNFIMAGIFAVLFLISTSRFFLTRYPHPHSLNADQADPRALAARHWRRKEVALLDIALALGIAFVVAAVSIQTTRAIKANVDSRPVQAVFDNSFVLITLLIVVLTTVFHRWMERIQGTEELGMYLLYVFFFVIGLRANLWQVILNMPVLFTFCLTIAGTNLVFTLIVGRLLRQNLEELLLSVNATLGGAPSAAAFAVSKGWPELVLPGLLAGIWGYVIGTFVGIAVAETLTRIL